MDRKNTEALNDVIIKEDDVINVVPEEEVIVGDEVLDLPNTPQYNIHFPFRRGDVNTHSDIGGSLSSILKGMSWDNTSNHQSNWFVLSRFTGGVDPQY